MTSTWLCNISLGQCRRSQASPTPAPFIPDWRPKYRCASSESSPTLTLPVSVTIFAIFLFPLCPYISAERLMATQTLHWGTEAWIKGSSMEESVCLRPYIREGKWYNGLKQLPWLSHIIVIANMSPLFSTNALISHTFQHLDMCSKNICKNDGETGGECKYTQV